MKKKAYFSIILFTLISCETETYIDYSIDNQSANTISVKGSNIIHSSTIDNEMNSGEKRAVSGWSQRGKFTELLEPVSMFGEDLIITNSVGDTLIKDYKLLSNWSSDVTDKKFTASHEYILIITDSDF